MLTKWSKNGCYVGSVHYRYYFYLGVDLSFLHSSNRFWELVNTTMSLDGAMSDIKYVRPFYSVCVVDEERSGQSWP
jgi:hypothetical protein